MSNDKPIHTSLVSVALLKFGDKRAWQLACEILGAAGIPAISEGGLGMVEICVDASQAGAASALLKNEPRLNGKLFTSDELRVPPKQT